MKGHEAKQKKAVIYARVSNVKQTQRGTGLDSQITRCTEYARYKGLDIVEVFRDDMSGSVVTRPGMKAMLAFLRKHRAHGVTVIIDDISRLARGIDAHLQLRAAIANAGGFLASPSIEFGEDSDSQLVENLLASVSQHQRQKNGEQTKNRMRAKAMNGYWVFSPPPGYRYEKAQGQGRVLVRNEPMASHIQQALEGYASGRFQSKAEVARFLGTHPDFPKDHHGRVADQRAHDVLSNPLYAGYVTVPRWDLRMIEGKHPALISYETHQSILMRMAGKAKVAARTDAHHDFPLRGFVRCGCCDNLLTACWTKGSDRRHPYYLCHRRGCPAYGKSIRRDQLHGDFENLLKQATPTPRLFEVVEAMFRDVWNSRLKLAQQRAKAAQTELRAVEQQIVQLLDRVVEATSPSVVSAYERRIEELEETKAELRERTRPTSVPQKSFEATFRTCLAFLSNPWKLWVSERYEDKRAVLKLAFAHQLAYVRGEGFRTPEFSMPFRALELFSTGEEKMAPRAG